MDYEKYFPNEELRKRFEGFLKAKEENKTDVFFEELKKEFDKSTDEEKARHVESSKESLNSVSERVDELKLNVILSDISDVISKSYIAKKYFGKSRYWLYQRIKGNTVNGKPAKFTDEERKKLAEALKEISKEIYETSLRIS